jgi:3-oxoacyl-[acyl-carrier protein] reductase/meso-butanediol dehydrogenase/(S,S)-butanediol dehydrogenase/diacetyl reductase
MKIQNIKRTVVITGGNRGIGEAITRAFWEEGYHVLIGAGTDTKLAGQLGEKVRFQKMDVRLESNHRMLVEAAIKWTGRLDVFINCAGFSEWRPVHEVDSDFWDKMIDTNLKGTFWGCKVASESLSKGGCIINISSLAGKRGSSNNSVYCASKFGVNGLTQALAKELGVKGIRVNAVCPVYIQTEGLMEALKDKRSPARGQDIGSYLEKFAAEDAALKRLPTGDEVASMCLFLASNKASAITGQCINIDCGVLPQ